VGERTRKNPLYRDKKKQSRKGEELIFKVTGEGPGRKSNPWHRDKHSSEEKGKILETGRRRQ